jgi:hypothetical protein
MLVLMVLPNFWNPLLFFIPFRKAALALVLECYGLFIKNSAKRIFIFINFNSWYEYKFILLHHIDGFIRALVLFVHWLRSWDTFQSLLDNTTLNLLFSIHGRKNYLNLGRPFRPVFPHCESIHHKTFFGGRQWSSSSIQRLDLVLVEPILH